jgi:phosphatidylglycerophosphatase A
MKIRYHIPQGINPKNNAIRWATWFGCGFITPAPGTWGSLGALPFGVLLYALGGPILLLLALCAILPLGLWAAHEYGKAVQEHDSPQIVIDEVIGMWIALILAALNPALIIIAFLAFRFFDTLKPWPICFFDKKVKNAAGVILDDVIAGLFACLCVVGADLIF